MKPKPNNIKKSNINKRVSTWNNLNCDVLLNYESPQVLYETPAICNVGDNF